MKTENPKPLLHRVELLMKTAESRLEALDKNAMSKRKYEILYSARKTRVDILKTILEMVKVDSDKVSRAIEVFEKLDEGAYLNTHMIVKKALKDLRE